MLFYNQCVNLLSQTTVLFYNQCVNLQSQTIVLFYNHSVKSETIVSFYNHCVILQSQTNVVFYSHRPLCYFTAIVIFTVTDHCFDLQPLCYLKSQISVLVYIYSQAHRII